MIATGNVMVYIFVAGVAATAIWRFAGFALSAGLSEEGPVIQWVRSVSTALIAGLISRIILFPPGALADMAPAVRLGAFGFGVAVYFLARRHMGFGVLAGASALVATHLLNA